MEELLKVKVSAKTVVRDILEEKGMTLVELADKLGMSRQNLNGLLELGTDRDLKVETFVKMLDVLGYEIQVKLKGLNK